jgi:energy-coupling factor transport system permease protein
VLWHLPLLTLQLGPLGSVNFLGDLTIQSFSSALTDGLRLAAIMLSLALANILGGPQALLQAAPAALHGLASALVISLNLAPQLASSFIRVRQARAIRGRSERISAMKSLFVPVLEDAFERSMNLAASMDSRGFGYRSTVSVTSKFWQRSLLSLSLLSACLATYLLLATDLPTAGLVGVATALASLTAAIHLASKNYKITRLEPQRWPAFDLLTLGTSVVIVLFSLIGELR